MKIAEIRIGNLLQHKGKTIRVSSVLELMNIVHDSDRFTIWNLSDLQPIEITEEWLFEINLIFKDGKYKFPDNEWFSVGIEGSWTSLYCNNIYYAVDFKYVHELQNLYFSITQNELLLKSPSPK